MGDLNTLPTRLRWFALHTPIEDPVFELDGEEEHALKIRIGRYDPDGRLVQVIEFVPTSRLHAFSEPLLPGLYLLTTEVIADAAPTRDVDA